MGFSSEINDRLDSLAENFFNIFNGGDVSADERVARIRGQIGEVFQFAGLAQAIQVHNVNFILLHEHVANEVGTDKPRSTGNQQFHGAFLVVKPGLCIGFCSEASKTPS